MVSSFLVKTHPQAYAHQKLTRLNTKALFRGHGVRPGDLEVGHDEASRRSREVDPCCLQSLLDQKSFISVGIAGRTISPLPSG